MGTLNPKRERGFGEGKGAFHEPHKPRRVEGWGGVKRRAQGNTRRLGDEPALAVGSHGLRSGEL
jgi:hypothetical protein